MKKRKRKNFTKNDIGGGVTVNQQKGKREE